MKLNYRTQRNAESISRFWGKPLDHKDWFKVQAQGDDETEIMIYDVIGWPYIDAAEFVRTLQSISSKQITVRINSPGGDVFDGMAIFNAMKTHSSKIVTRIEGIAASMASIIALAGQEVQAYSNTMYMVHEPWGLAVGNQFDLRELADLLGKLSGQMIDVYAANSTPGKREIAQMMKDETWLTAKEAKDKGFIDTIIDGKSAKAQFDLSMFANVPDCMGSGREGGELSEREIERALRDAGASRSFAKAVAAGGSNGNQADQREVDSLKVALNSTIAAIKGGR